MRNDQRLQSLPLFAMHLLCYQQMRELIGVTFNDVLQSYKFSEERTMNLENIAQRLDTAAVKRMATEQTAGFDLSQAYEIQKKLMDYRYKRGEKQVGIKLGFTSRAKMIQMGVDALIWGVLTDGMLREEGGIVSVSDFIHPRAEPEVCFLTRKDIDRPLTLLEVNGYLEGAAPAIEIIDSRYENFKFTLEAVVADNCSSAGLVVGPMARVDTELGNLGVVLGLNGQAIEFGSTAAVLGNPLRAVVQASHLLAQAEIVLPAGSLLMSGAATAAVALPSGAHVTLNIGGLGRAEFYTA